VHLERLLRQKLPDFGEQLPWAVGLRDGSVATGRTRVAVVAAQSIGIRAVEEKKKNLDGETTQEKRLGFDQCQCTKLSKLPSLRTNLLF
jgi:hypothetical protein